MVIVIINVIVIIGSLIAMITDIKTHKIYNKLTIPMFFSGYILNILAYGKNSIKQLLIWTIIGIGLIVLMSLLKGFGGGDKKLILALTILKGYEFIFFILIVTAIIMIIYLVLFKNDKVKKTFFNIKTIISSYLISKTLYHIEKDNSGWVCPYGIFIFLGVIVYYIYQIIKVVL